MFIHSSYSGIRSFSTESDALKIVVEGSGAGLAEASPDGRWIVYSSMRTGRREIRVRSFPEGDFDREISTATGGGMEPVWCRECNEIFYRNGNRWYASKVQFEPEISFGIPQLVFVVPGFVDTAERSFDISRDGKRLLVLRSVNEPTRTKLHLVHNWFAELERLVPGDEE